MAKIDLSLFDISTIEARSKKRNPHKYKQDTENVYECERPCCNEPAYYKAPKSPQNLNQYRYFCLKHIREHNQRWNFCENMTEQDIISHLEKDVIGHRPTWQSGMSVGGSGKGSAYKRQESYSEKPFAFDDPFDLSKTIFDTINPQKNTQKQKLTPHYDSKLQKIYDACQVLAVEFPPELNILKQNYKKLVKQYHPDINKHDINAEQKLRQILDAYRLIKDFLEK